MYYYRHIENVIKRLAKRKSAIIITGARQVGKSTMLKETLGGISYISMDSPLVRESAKQNPSLFFDIHKPPLIVDEIQKAADLFEYLKIIIDEHKKKASFS